MPRRRKTSREPVDILSLTKDLDTTFRRAGNPRCGVCLFHLSRGAGPSNIDVEEKHGCFREDFGREVLKASASRGCRFCKNMIKFGLRCGALDISLEQKVFYQRLKIITSDEMLKPYIFILPLKVPYEDLPRAFDADPRYPHDGLRPICRGRATIKMKSTADDHVLDQAKFWWETCVRRHKCQAVRPSYFPSRLLRLDHRIDDTVVWLETMTKPVQYVTLSHRWSQETEGISLTQSNHRERMEKGMLATELPRLMQDTVYVLRRFCVEYLWIDSLCIIQGDDGDWKHEAASMASIYKNATFTISATKCQGSHESLFSDPTKIATGAYVGKLPGGVNVRLEEEPNHPFTFTEDEEYLGGEDLLDRGWVYQEVLLSPRTLYFLRDEIMWRCQEYRVCQCARYDADELDRYDEGIQAEKGIHETYYVSKRRHRSITFRSWANILDDYIPKKLTFSKDRLPALAGVAEEFGKARQWTYICGLWQEDIVNDLRWHRNEFQEPTPRPKGRQTLPTWSWAAFSGELQFSGLGLVGSKPLEFESCDVVYNGEGGNPYLGDVKEAVLTITGDVFPAKLTRKCDSHDLEAITSKWSDRCRYGVSIRSKYFMGLTEDFILDESILDRPDVLCLAFGNTVFDRFQGLVLYCVDRKAERYERLGWIAGIDENACQWRSWDVVRRQVTMV